MPYKDKEFHQYCRRVWRREQRHPGWRQVFVDCDGMCQWAMDGGVCGEVEKLEFHELFAEDKKGDGRMQKRILYCIAHHFEAHQGIVNERHHPGKLQEDVAYEMKRCGGLAPWMVKYGLSPKLR